VRCLANLYRAAGVRCLANLYRAAGAPLLAPHQQTAEKSIQNISELQKTHYALIAHIKLPIFLVHFFPKKKRTKDNFAG